MSDDAFNRLVVTLVAIPAALYLLSVYQHRAELTPQDRAVLLNQFQAVSRAPSKEMVPCPDQAAEAKQAGFGEGWTWYCAKGTK